MSESITENTVEQITVNPDQTIQLVQNEDKFENTAQYNQAVFNPSIVTPKTVKTLDDMTDWKEYLHNPWNATQSGQFRFEKFKPIMDMSRDPIWYSLTQKYGRDMAMKIDTILGYYKPAGNAFDRTVDAWNYSADSLRLADARARLSDARASGNYGAQAEIENEIADLKYKLANRDVPFESETWSSIMSVATSGARNLPEIVMANIAAWAAAPYTGTASIWAGRGITADIIYNDTYNIEFGNILHDIMTSVPDITEEQAREYAKVGATLSAAIEAVPSIIPGLDVLGGVGQRAGAAVVGKGVKKGLWEYMKALSAKDPRVTKLFMKKLFATLGDMGIEVGSESLQEGLQDIVSGAALKGAETGGDVLDISEQRLIDFISDPLNPANADLWNTFGYTAAGTGVFEGATRILTGGLRPVGRLARRSMANVSRRRQPRTIEQQGLGATMNVELADRLHQMRQEGKVPDEVQQELWDRSIARGIAPEKIYLDKQMAETLMQDPSVATAMEQLGVQAALQESESNGGLVEIDFAKYDEVVNKDDALFQKIRTAISFSPEALSLNQFQAYVDSLNARSRTELENARQLSDSVYNRVLNALLQQGVDRQLAEAQAITAQFMANRAGTLRLGQPRTGEQAAARLEIRMPGQPGSVQTTAPQTEVKSLQSLRDETQTSINLFGETSKFAGEQAYKAATENPSLIPAGEEQGVPYDANDFGAAVNDEIDSLRSETSFPRGRPQARFKEDSPIRQAARKWLAEDPVGQKMVADAKQHAAEIDLALEAERAAEATEQSIGDTIVVDGVERPTKNSEGNLIGNTEESLTNFWRWFGDSKVVDEQGRPLVVYHGTDTEFEAFNKKYIGKNAAKLGGGFYATNVEKEAGGYGKPMMLYASIQNPLYVTNFSKNISKEDRQKLYDYLKDYSGRTDGDFRDNLDSDDEMFLHDLFFDIKYDVRYEKYVEAIQTVLGVDGIINTLKGTDGVSEYVVYDPTQFKRTDNLGTWSPTDERTLYQFLGGQAIEEQNLGAQRDEAQRRVEAGEDPEVVRQETGFYQEADGSWVFEISDSDMQSRKASKFVNSDGTLGATGVTTLGEILDAPTLYKFVPWIKDLEVEIKKSKGQTWGEANSSKIWLYAKNFTTEDLLLDTLAHEIQHVLQRHYEFMQSNGRSSPKSGKKTFIYQPGKIAETVLKDPNYKRMVQLAQTLADKVSNIAPTFKAVGTTRQYMDLYARRGQLQQWAKDGILDQAEVDEFVDLYQKYGETERGTSLKFGDYLASGWEYMARNTATRRTLTEEQRRTTSPAQTRDMEGNVWIINAGSGNTNYVPAALPGAPIKEGGPTQISTQEPGGEGGGVIAGMFFREGDKLVITLTPNANATTLTHELFHWFAYELQEAYNSGEMTPYWKKKMEALARMVDAKPQVDPADPTVMRYFLTEAQEEKAADMFLNFIKDGKIKNQEVRPLFSYLQDEFRRIFRLAQIKRYPISNDAQEVFDSIFAAQDVIEDEQRLVGMYQIVKPDGADQDLYDFYTGEMESSQVRGTQELHRKWAGIEKYRQEEKYRKVYNETRLEVANELNQDARYIVLEEAGKHGNDPMATWSALQTNPATSDLELSVDQVAEIIATTPDKTSEIDRITNERMDAHIQEVFKITPEEMGLRASRNASKVKALLAEALMREGKVLSDFEAEYKALLDKADEQVAKSKLTRLADKEYWDTLESNIVERYAYAVANADQRAMAAARRDQAIVNAIRMRAESIVNRARRFQETAADFRGAQKKIAKSNEYKYAARDYDLLQSILEKFGFPINYARRKPTPVAQKLDDWIEEQESVTLTRAGELRNFIPFVQEGFDGDFVAMTGAQFEKLEAVFNAVKAVAGAKYSILLANDKMLLSSLVKATQDNMAAKGLAPFEKKNNWWSKHFGTMGTWTNPEPVVRAIFPPEVLDNVWLPFIDAAVKAERYGGQWVQRYRAAKAKVDLSNKAKTYSIGKAFTNQQVADLFLAMGNQHALDNFLLAYGISQEEAEAVVSEALTDHPELADFVNEVWAIYSTATEVLDREFEERTNTLFVEKDHRSFEVNGIKFGGGYVPARKAMDYVPTDPRAGNQGGMVHDKKFEKLVTKSADGNIRSIVDITENELFQSAKQGFTAVEYNNARKFLLADGTKAAIGDRAFSFLEQWLTAYMAPIYDTNGWVRPLASLTTTAALGFRLSTALLQLSGLGPAMAVVGPRYFSRGLTMAMKNGEWAPYFATKKGANKSDYMSVRIADPRSSLLGLSITDAVRAQDANTKLGKVSKFLLGKAGNLAMIGIQYVDTFVANVTWNGAYLKALDSGKSELEARREADSIVRTVQSDSLQVSRATSMQSSLARVFTAFATWIMAMQSGLRARLATKQYTDAVIWASMYMVLSPIFESFLKEATKIGGDDDDEEYLDRVLKGCYNEIASTFGTSIFPVAGLGGALSTGIFSGIEEGITGEKEIFEVRQSNTPALQTAYRAINTARYTLAGNFEKAATYGASTVSTEAGKIVKYLLAE